MSSRKSEMVEPSEAPLEELAAAIAAGAVRLAAATSSWLRLVAAFDERGGWHGIGITSCAHWLAWQCGMGPGTAREHVRVARALRSLPLIAAAFAAGRLSYAKVRALTRVAAPDCEAALLEFALSATASQAERFCRTWRRLDEDDQRPPGRPEDRVAFEYSTDEEGFTLKVRGPAETGAALMAAIDSLAERAARRERAQNKKAAARQDAMRAAGGRVDWQLAERCAEDAAIGLARERTAGRRLAALTSLAEARVTLDRRAGDPPRREVVVHVDAAVLADDAAAGRAHFAGGPAVTGAQARRMLCEATVLTMLEAGREPLAVGRRRRFATRAQRRALLRRDGGCARPGCPEARIERLHAHHMRHWLFGGRTDLTNLVLLCDADHGEAHDRDLVMTRANGRLIVTTPDGRRVWGTADAAFAAGLPGLPAPGSQAASGADPFAGVHPIDTQIGRRPSDALPADAPPAAPAGRALPRRRHTGHRLRAASPLRRRRAAPAGGPAATGRPASRRPGRATTGATAAPGTPARETQRLGRLLFPDGEPDLPATLQDRYDRMDLAYAIGVLMGNRELIRRLADEGRVPLGT